MRHPWPVQPPTAGRVWPSQFAWARFIRACSTIWELVKERVNTHVNLSNIADLHRRPQCIVCRQTAPLDTARSTASPASAAQWVPTLAAATWGTRTAPSATSITPLPWTARTTPATVGGGGRRGREPAAHPQRARIPRRTRALEACAIHMPGQSRISHGALPARAGAGTAPSRRPSTNLTLRWNALPAHAFSHPQCARPAEDTTTTLGPGAESASWASTALEVSPMMRTSAHPMKGAGQEPQARHSAQGRAARPHAGRACSVRGVAPAQAARAGWLLRCSHTILGLVMPGRPHPIQCASGNATVPKPYCIDCPADMTTLDKGSTMCGEGPNTCMCTCQSQLAARCCTQCPGTPRLGVPPLRQSRVPTPAWFAPAFESAPLRNALS